MKREPEFYFDENEGISYCAIGTKADDVFVGTAKCHPDDIDMESEKTGCEIAFKRAKIKLYQAYKNEIEIKIKAIHDLYYSLNQSKSFNENSYESKMIQRQLRLLQFDLTTAKEIIATERKFLKEYIDSKENFYKRIRANRKHKGNS